MVSARATILFVGLALGCSSTSTAPTPPQRERPAAIDAAALESALASLGEGGTALLELVGDDTWFAHYGSTLEIRGGDALRSHLRELAGAYPGLRFAPGAPIPIHGTGWIVELAMRDERRGGQVPLVALVGARDGALASLELFGADPRDAFAAGGDGGALAGVSAFEGEPTPSRAALELATSLGGQARIRLSARSGDQLLAIVDVEGRTKRKIPLVRHIAAIASVDGDRVSSVRMFMNPREGATIEMGNSSASWRLQSRVDSDVLHWGASLVYCCEHGRHTRMCDRVRTIDMPACRATGALALVCREAYHCTGAECFCCSHGIDGACAIEPMPEPEPEIEVPEGRRPPEPSIWSPY
ncbi:MAG TPA: hypothetical protein VFG69_11940 [Nannocystaceae bacterium]|nr:hypothetical protein [Nannocystaceae bacterium]